MQKSAKDYVEAIRAVAPKYDKHLHSKVQRPGLYGIRLTTAAEAAIVVAFGEPYNRSKVDKHKLKAKVQCRLTEYEIDRLQQALQADGFLTMQDCLSHLIRAYTERICGVK